MTSDTAVGLDPKVTRSITKHLSPIISVLLQQLLKNMHPSHSDVFPCFFFSSH